jgi:hypothetical protein
MATVWQFRLEYAEILTVDIFYGLECIQCSNSKRNDPYQAVWFGLWCLTPLSTIFQIYRAGRFHL